MVKQRKEGKTPHEKRLEADAKADAVKAHNVRLIDEIDTLTTRAEDLRRALAYMEKASGIEAPKLPESVRESAPQPMLLHCPACHQQHIDVGEFATRPHRTHRCTAEAGNGPGCGKEWRPALIRTVGVRELPDG